MNRRHLVALLLFLAVVVVCVVALVVSDRETHDESLAQGFPGAHGSFSCTYYGYFWDWTCHGHLR